MPILVSWCEKYSDVICVEICLPWDWSEFRSALEQATTLINDSGAVRAFIVDVRPAGDFPPNGFIRHSRYALNYLPNVPMIFHSDTRLMPMLMTPVINVMRAQRQYHFVHTQADVDRIITDILSN